MRIQSAAGLIVGDSDEGNYKYKTTETSDLEKYDDYRRSFSNEFGNTGFPSSYSNSSRETSGSYRPMLHKRHLKRQKHGHFYARIVRYLCLALISTVLIFILSLVRASWTSSRQLEAGMVEKQAPKPPPWENFVFLTRYFGGVRSLVPREKNIPEYPRDPEAEERQDQNSTKLTRKWDLLPKSVPFDPYPDYSSANYIAEYEQKHECFLDHEGLVKIPRVHYYVGVPQGFPDAAMGSYGVLGLRDDICFERFGRLGPYGFGYSVRRGGTGAGLEGDREGAMDFWLEDKNVTAVDYSNIRWAQIQEACALKNKKRFVHGKSVRKNLFQNMRTLEEHEGSTQETPSMTKRKTISRASLKPSNSTIAKDSNAKKKIIPRTAIIIRTWWDRQYSPEDIIYLRSLIAELSLLSGGEYIVHFLVHVRDDNLPIWADEQIYNRILENALPGEFHGMGTLWSEKQMSLIYGGLEESFFRDLPVHGVYRGTFLPVQYFSHQHPEYDFFWNWEMDVRYTGQWYHLLDRVRGWTKAQPRKGLWERNGRFYIPSVHGSWEDFRQMVRVQTEMGTDSPNNLWSAPKAGPETRPGASSSQSKADTPVWGPLSPPDMLRAQEDPMPPTTIEKDKYEWGVGEEADLITFNPIFDPDGTTWFFTEDVTGYNVTEGLPPRRAAITTTSRLSRRLLRTMHRETMLARHIMFSEMWPASCALHHGYKAVYAPHPVYIDRDWPTSYLASVMNAGRNGASGGARTSVYGSREHNFKGTTWFYEARFAPNLWRRWLGYKVDNDGGEQAELAGEGRMCLPGILVHPIKDFSLVVEGGEQVEEPDQMEAEIEKNGDREFGDVNTEGQRVDIGKAGSS